MWLQVNFGGIFDMACEGLGSDFVQEGFYCQEHRQFAFLHLFAQIWQLGLHSGVGIEAVEHALGEQGFKPL